MPWHIIGYLGTDETPWAKDGSVALGDLGWAAPDGCVFISGRSKEMIKTGGENVFPGEVENVIQLHAAVEDTGVYGMPDETWGERVEAAIVLRDGAELDVAELRAFCAARLAGERSRRSSASCRASRTPRTSSWTADGCKPTPEPLVADPRGCGEVPVAAVRDVDGIVAAAAREAFAGRPEVGMQVAVWLGGELIVDVSVGYADLDGRRPVDRDTLFPVFSVTKGLVATAIHRAADDGLLDLTAPVSAYWPGFAAGGKAAATVADTLTHSVGIPAMPDGCTVEQMCDWQHMTSAVEAMPALREPGRATGYHAYTYGWIAGELLRRVRGDDDPAATMSNALAELGVGNFWIGLPAAQLDRVATLYTGPGGPARGPNALFDRALPGRDQTAAERVQPAGGAASLPARGRRNRHRLVAGKPVRPPRHCRRGRRCRPCRRSRRSRRRAAGR